MRKLLSSAVAIALMFGATVATATPPQEDIDFAEDVNDALLSDTLALLLARFAATTDPQAPADIVDIGIAALRLSFDNQAGQARLVGTLENLGGFNSRPKGPFEKNALKDALQGIATDKTLVQGPFGRFYVRQFVPLSNFDPSCGLCHTNFGPVDPTQWVGGLSITTPVVPKP